MVILWILTATFLVSIISLIGVLTLSVKENLLKQILFYLIGFSAGSLIGSAFLHILPEALLNSPSKVVFSYFILGLIIFFLMEKYFYWRHCHEGSCDVHAFTYLNLIGDGFHNLIDGMLIAASFVVSVKLGVVTTLAVIFHEIPQELGDFGVLVYGGFSKRKALMCNFISALMAMVGAVLGYFLADLIPHLSNFILPLTAGGFTYIATSDLIPEIHREINQKRSMLAFVAFLFGIGFMVFASIVLKD
jgi:zinc and cadmium transporter